MMKHLAIFLPSLDGGGAEKVMLALAERFVSRGVQCDLVIAISKGALLNQVPKGVRLIKLGKLKTIRAVFALTNYLNREHPNTLLATVFSANICALLAATLSPARTRIVTCEASLPDIDARSSQPWRTIVNRIAARTLYRTADSIIAISSAVRFSLLKSKLARSSHIHTIYNPILIPSKQIAKKNPSSTPLIISCGRLELQKDYPTLLRAFARIRAKQQAKLVILGEGSLRHTLEMLTETLGISDDVVFSGFVNDPIIHMRDATVFTHSACYEGFGVVFLEALTCGLPIVATDCPGGTREVLADGRFGTLVPVGDDLAMAVAIENILARKVTFPDATEHLKQFDIERITDLYLDVLFPASSHASNHP